MGRFTVSMLFYAKRRQYLLDSLIAAMGTGDQLLVALKFKHRMI